MNMAKDDVIYFRKYGKFYFSQYNDRQPNSMCIEYHCETCFVNKLLALFLCGDLLTMRNWEVSLLKLILTKSTRCAYVNQV